MVDLQFSSDTKVVQIDLEGKFPSLSKLGII